MSKYINTNALIRIIDAQMSNIECLKQIQDKKFLEGKSRHCTMHYSTKLETLNNVLKTIDEIQETDVVPVIHATNLSALAWCDKLICSHCGIVLQDWVEVRYDENIDDTMYHEYVFNYCPNCGAKIEEGNAESE